MSPLELSALLFLEQTDFLKHCLVENYQASGRGGQKRNKVKSARRCRLVMLPLTAENSDQRESALNLLYAVRKLKLRLAVHLAAHSDKSAADSIKQYLIQEQLVFQADVHPRNPRYAPFALLALVTLRLAGGSYKKAAESLQCSTSAFIRFLKNNKLLWETAQSVVTSH
ncbi:MAG: hypothetical protein KDK39_08445 [Leptospiraceae bacterium]|nr:hypothetical protein [Leptospiraceae bacterium]